MIVVCPRCHGNGLIERVKFSDLNTEFNICNECESCWDKEAEITKENFEFLDQYMKKLGATDDSKLEVLGYLEKST